MSIIHKITTQMKAKGVPASKLTSDLGLPNSAISEWKKGKAKPSSEAIVKLAQYFNVSTDYLLGLDTLAASVPVEQIPFQREEFKDLTHSEVETLAVLAKTLKAQRLNKND